MICKNFIFIYALIIILIVKTASAQEFPALKGAYFGQKAPRNKAEVFLDKIISKIDDPEMNAAFTPDGKEFYYCALYKNNWTIFFTKEVNGRWIRPKPISFTSNYTDRDFTMSPDVSGSALTLPMTGMDGSLKDTLLIYSVNPSTAGFISGEWNAPLTWSCMARLAPAAVAISIALTILSAPPLITIWPGELTLAMTVPESWQI